MTLRSYAAGETPLDARLEPWMIELARNPAAATALIEDHGSPVNVHDFSSLERNAREMIDAGARSGVTVKVFVARKANKTLGLVDAVKKLGTTIEVGIDLGSERELLQVLDRGLDPSRIIFTAAVKPERVLRHALSNRVPVALDNLDETRLARLIGRQVRGGAPGAAAPIVLRLAPTPSASIAPTRFGESTRTWLAELDREGFGEAGLRIDGVHFHLHGYAAGNRSEALAEAISFVDELRSRGHNPTFIDIGGGVPMSYLESEEQWEDFWREHERAKRGERKPLTWRGDAFGRGDLYPYHQQVTRGSWLERVLTPELSSALRERGLALHCEPGRAMLDGCGMTLARVAFRKRTSDGVPIVGLEMNRTQCRSTSADFLVDPILIPAGSGQSDDALDREIRTAGAFLVGAYCIEAELILRRRIVFPRGVQVGDLVAFPNTGGYLMHILESASHQIPLAANVVASADGFVRDDIDAAGGDASLCDRTATIAAGCG